MAEAVISLVVQTIGNLLIEEGNFLYEVGDQANQLHQDLKRLLWFLKDADTRQNEPDRLSEWISQTKDLAYQAENLLERYAFTIQSPRERGITSVIKRCICLLDEGLNRHQIGLDIKYLKVEISNFTKCLHEFGIRPIMETEGCSSTRKQQLRRTYSHITDEEDLVGVKGQVEMLAKELIGENCRVVSICGMGGLGKTTLARQVYHHPDVRCHFEGFSWVCVSQQWQKKDLLLGIAVKLMPEEEDLIAWREEELVRELFKFQKVHKCLIVLDDIWSPNAWDCIKDAFPIGEKGSRVILTSRNKEVATHIGSIGFLYEPDFLDPEASWGLLQRKSRIQRRTLDCDQIHEMEELGKDMVQHCGGLPLAIITLGGILTKREGLIEWQKVHKNVTAYIGKKSNIKEDQEEVQNILELSYNELPYQLKPCFLYLSKYPEDVEIETESLYQIWMAEGLISMDENIREETMMDIAENYLGELVERSMVFVEMEEVPLRRRFKSCRLHDLMRELCLLKAKRENFLQLINYRDRNDIELADSSFLTRTHRLATYLDYLDDTGYVCLKRGASQHLRSFTGCSKETIHIQKIMKRVVADFTMLRVLIIKNKDGHSSIRVPSAIGKCIHLRYLELWGKYCHFILPKSIGKLKHLQTLALCFDGRYESIPDVIWRLKRLKHLYLPLFFGNEVRLDGLHNLEILENFANRLIDVKVLSTLTNLRCLEAFVNKDDDLEEFVIEVSKLSYLRSLSLEIDRCDFCSEKGSTLLREVFSSGRLTRLWIWNGRTSKLPEYEPCFLPNLYVLSLGPIKMEEDPMRTLERLPNLRHLSLFKESFIKEEMTCHATGFPQLKTLVLEGLDKLKNWLVEEGAMPKLSTLKISQCRELKMIPSGLSFIRTLEELEIKDMPQEFRRRLQVADQDGQEGEDFDKIRHVPSVIIQG